MPTTQRDERTGINAVTTPEPESSSEADDGEPSGDVSCLPQPLLDLLEALADIC